MRGKPGYSQSGRHGVKAIAGAEIIQYRSKSNTNRLYGYDAETGNFTKLNPISVFPLNPRGNGQSISQAKVLLQIALVFKAPESWEDLARYANEILKESGDEGLAIATGLIKACEYFEDHPEEKNGSAKY